MLKSFAFLLLSYFCLSTLDSMITTLELNKDWFSLALFLIILTGLNMIVVPIFKLLTFPINFLTLGLFNTLLNLFVIWIAIDFSKVFTNTAVGPQYLINLAFISFTISIVNMIIDTVL